MSTARAAGAIASLLVIAVIGVAPVPAGTGGSVPSRAYEWHLAQTVTDARHRFDVYEAPDRPARFCQVVIVSMLTEPIPSPPTAHDQRASCGVRPFARIKSHGRTVVQGPIEIVNDATGPPAYIAGRVSQRATTVELDTRHERIAIGTVLKSSFIVIYSGRRQPATIVARDAHHRQIARCELDHTAGLYVALFCQPSAHLA